MERQKTLFLQHLIFQEHVIFQMTVSLLRCHSEEAIWFNCGFAKYLFLANLNFTQLPKKLLDLMMMLMDVLPMYY